MPVSIMNTGVYEPVMYTLHAIVLGLCALQLARRYVETRERLTLLFVAYFSFMTVISVTDLLLVMDVIMVDLLETMALLALITTGLVATIGVVLLGYKQIYLLPAMVVLIAFLQYIPANAIYDLALTITRTYMYMNGVGNPWFITLKSVFPNFLSPNQQVAIMVNLFLDPAKVLLRDTPLITLSMYESVIGVPTMVLFYYLALANRSGRSLGFALYLTTLTIWGILVSSLIIESRSLISLLITLLSFIFLALGVFGILDKTMPKRLEE